MISNSKSLTIMLSLIFGIIGISQIRADIGEIIQGGIDYLEANQDETSHLWGTDKETPFRDATVAVDILATLDAEYTVNPEIIESGYLAISSIPTTSTDYFARKIMVEASVNDGGVASEWLDSLASMQNEDGAWGYQKYYGSNTLETALAIKALVAGSYVDPEPSVFGPASDFLVECQNSSSPDFGWGFVDGGDSKVLFTAHAMIALSALQDYDANYDFTTEIANAFIWFQAVIEDGAFNGNAYETGLAIAAMVAHDPAAQEIEDAWGYLESTQLLGGSWNNDAYSTAMAIYGLHSIDPDNFLVYEYRPGDANMFVGGWPPMVMGGDVTYLVNFFGGTTQACYLDGFYCSADANGDCYVTGGDVTRLVNYFGGTAQLEFCPAYPTDWAPWPQPPPPMPEGWPNCEGAAVARNSPPKSPLINPALNSGKNESIVPGRNKAKKEPSIIQENQNNKKKEQK